MLGRVDSGKIKTKINIATKEEIALERYSDAQNGFTISVYIGLSKGAKTGASKTGLAIVDSVVGMPGFAIDVGICGGQSADKTELVKNAGFALGEGFRKLLEKRKGSAKETGSTIHSRGGDVCTFAINARRQPGEANLQIIGTPGHGFEPEHFFAFFDGFAQGFEAEVNAVLSFGSAKKDEKSRMDFVSRAFANALEQIVK